jgi:hypothetical protein
MAPVCFGGRVAAAESDRRPKYRCTQHKQELLEILQLLCPHARLLLLPYLARGGHTALAAAAARRLEPRFQQQQQQYQIDPGGGGSDPPACSPAPPRRLAPISIDHPQLGGVDVLRFALQAALQARAWGAAETLLRARVASTLSAVAIAAGDPDRAEDPTANLGSLCAALQALRLPAPDRGPAAAAAGLEGMDEVAARAACGEALLAALVQCQPREPDRCYLLAAAAGSGRVEAVQAALRRVRGGGMAVRCQLPAALGQAGRGGHVQVVEALLRNEQMSSRPLEVRWLVGGMVKAGDNCVDSGRALWRSSRASQPHPFPNLPLIPTPDGRPRRRQPQLARPRALPHPRRRPLPPPRRRGAHAGRLHRGGARRGPR